MNSPVVRNVASSDRARVSALMTLAFARDPLLRWIYEEGDRYLRYFDGFLDAYCGDAFASRSGACYADVGSGAVLWVSPTQARNDDHLSSFLQRTATESRRDEVLRLFDRFGECHPHTPHYYITLLGRDPCTRNRGVGSELMDSIFERCDRERAFAYGEATTPAHVKFYRRLGCELVDVVQVGTSPRFFPMIRAPR
ncbi:GNAT family N-acetyltransferase [Mycobacterium sp. KBS0706]|uniref:GNAT family N-acetyltransferase n=1 Tax=Mycobacterium sp. KBS0706 TaxID=2578109 RepID=UPI00110F76E7|nr:GNAT family N-acetyltransferase [Mycobacterium sp. KBS0706]TSD89370.1 GNAT family N-acetyltransferase [Mycobacterium sp. KBS0706]